MQLVDKITLLKKMNKTFFTIEDFQKSFNLKKGSTKKALGRMVKKGALRRLGRDVYVISGQEIDLKKIASKVYAPYAYVSYESALSVYGIISQIPYAVTMATCKATKIRPFFESELIIRKIKKELFFGYQLKDDVFIAEPEKALLDTLYLKSKGLVGLTEEELNLKELSKGKFLKMSVKFPRKVQIEARRFAKLMKR